MKKEVEVFYPGSFEDSNHFYPKALNSLIHPMVNHFFNLGNERIVERYHYLNPQVEKDLLKKELDKRAKNFFWGGADLFYVTTEQGNRKMVVLETNSCPSGQKSMPSLIDSDEFRGYSALVKDSFIPALKGRRLPEGEFAVIYDKNYVEASGYASTIAEELKRKVYLVPFFDDQCDGEFRSGILYIKDPETQEEVPIKAALRYVTQKPWTRIPVTTKTFIYNSTLVCLSGGRNKLVANKAYEIYNTKLEKSGLQINAPETIMDVSKIEIPLWVKKFGGHAVIKNPYSNAGQGVYTVTNEQELDEFMSREYDYDQFIVQSLIGHYNWSSSSSKGKYFHIGTLPNKRKESFVADLRIMVVTTPRGYKPVAIYARRAAKALKSEFAQNQESWSMLGTNLSVRIDKNKWSSDTSRLLLMDRKDFNTLGIGIDDLIEGYIQTVLSISAIDEMTIQLTNSKGAFRKKLFKSLDNDEQLVKEILY